MVCLIPQEVKIGEKKEFPILQHLIINVHRLSVTNTQHQTEG